MAVIKKGAGCAVVLLGGFFLAGGCVAVMVASQDEPASTSNGDRTAAAAAPASPSNGAYAVQVQNTVLDGLTLPELGRPATFTNMCQTTVVWACAIAEIESDDPGTINITLASEDVWIGKWGGSTDWYDFGEHVARGVYNFSQGIQPPLKQIDVLTSAGDTAYLGNF